jgi:SAM-dependent methyltransferase
MGGAISRAAGWDASAQAWIDSMGDHGDAGRRFVLDPALASWLEGRTLRRALDVGCGEGRVCRQLARRGIATVGLDPTAALLARARQLDPQGSYVEARAEAMPLPDGAFELVISCLSLIDIPDFRAAIDEMARVLAPGGLAWVANLTDFNTAAGQKPGLGWQTGAGGMRRAFAFDDYLDERASEIEWSGIHVINHHRPLHAYTRAFLSAGLVLRDHDIPLPVGAPESFVDHWRRSPWFMTMVWQKPLETGP